MVRLFIRIARVECHDDDVVNYFPRAGSELSFSNDNNDKLRYVCPTRGRFVRAINAKKYDNIIIIIHARLATLLRSRVLALGTNKRLRSRSDTKIRKPRDSSIFILYSTRYRSVDRCNVFFFFFFPLARDRHHHSHVHQSINTPHVDRTYDLFIICFINISQRVSDYNANTRSSIRNKRTL